MLHRESPIGDQHPIHNWEYADAAARLAATGFVAADVMKLAYQIDNATFWVLTDDSPIAWSSITTVAVDDTPVNGAATTPISSNWAYDHEAAADPHGGYVLTSEIGSSVQAYDADTAKLDVAQSWTAEQTFKELKDTVHTITDGAAFEIDPANGSVQIVTLGAARTPAATNFAAGQTVLLGIDDGTAYAITWTTVAPTWVKPGGTATAPTLATTGYTWILLWKVGSVIYGAEVGKP
jgi:hypothetical protein